MKPKIALPADTFAEATNVINERNAAFAPRPAIEAIVKSGGIPAILPSVDPSDVADYLDLFDGVAFLGGFDVDPTFFGEEPHQMLGATYRKRDLFELELLRQSVAAGKAILGICRGLQLINVGLGGTLYQDLSESDKPLLKHSQGAPGNLPSHHINVSENSELAKLVGERAYVNSRHHQITKAVAPSLRSPHGLMMMLLKALNQDSDQIIAVQWHPENMYKHDEASREIFENLVSRSQKV